MADPAVVPRPDRRRVRAAGLSCAPSTTGRPRRRSRHDQRLGRAPDPRPDQEAARPHRRDLDARLALVNAIYLKADWQHEFDPQRTVDRAFTTSLGASVRVPTMRMDRSQVVPLAHGTGWQADSAPYTGADGSPLSMTLILPDRLDAFEAGLTTRKLDSIATAIAVEQRRIGRLIPQRDGDMHCPAIAYDVSLSLPKFGVDTRAASCRSSRRWACATRSRRSSRLLRDRRRAHLYIAKVIHQANIDVDEPARRPPPRPPSRRHAGGCRVRPAQASSTLRFNHPFMFSIRDTRDRRDPVHGPGPRPVEALADGQRGFASQAFQVSSALPAVTSSPYRTSGTLSSRASASSRGDRRRCPWTGTRGPRRGRPWTPCRAAPARRAGRRTAGARRGRSASCAGRRSGRRSAARGRTGACSRVAASHPCRTPGCWASSSSVLPSGAGIGGPPRAARVTGDHRGAG